MSLGRGQFRSNRQCWVGATRRFARQRFDDPDRPIWCAQAVSHLDIGPHAILTTLPGHNVADLGVELAGNEKEEKAALQLAAQQNECDDSHTASHSSRIANAVDEGKA